MFRTLTLFALLTLIAAPAFAKHGPAESKANAGTPVADAPEGGDKANAKPFNVDATDSLEWRQNENMYVARGKAKVTRDDFSVTGDTLTAYQRPKKATTPGGKDSTEIWKFIAEGNVVISNGKADCYGDHGIYDIDTQVATLTGKNLHMISNADTLTATDKFEYYTAAHKAVAIGNAVAIRKATPGDANSGRTVKADTMTTYFVEDKNKNLVADHIEADGHVTVITATDVATGDHATYNLTAGNAILSGNVRLSRGASQLEGARAEVDFKSGVSRLLSDGKAASNKTGRVHGLLVPGANGGVVMPDAKKKQD